MKKIFLYLLIFSIFLSFSLTCCKSEEAPETIKKEVVEEQIEETTAEEEATESVEEEIALAEDKDEEKKEEEEEEAEVIASDKEFEENGIVFDIDMNVYHTVTIGTQVWMVENLKVTHYRNGNPIPNVTDYNEWGNLKTGAYCDYDNNPDFSYAYGRLYNWFTINDNREICPEGWHVPTDKDWEILQNYLGGVPVAGAKIKESGTTHWKSPNTGATNESGFTALPGGYRHFDGDFVCISYYGYWWAANDFNRSNAYYNYAGFHYSNLNSYWHSKKMGFSIRCIKD